MQPQTVACAESRRRDRCQRTPPSYPRVRCRRRKSARRPAAGSRHWPQVRYQGRRDLHQDDRDASSPRGHWQWRPSRGSVAAHLKRMRPASMLVRAHLNVALSAFSLTLHYVIVELQYHRPRKPQTGIACGPPAAARAAMRLSWAPPRHPAGPRRRCTTHYRSGGATQRGCHHFCLVHAASVVEWLSRQSHVRCPCFCPAISVSVQLPIPGNSDAPGRRRQSNPATGAAAAAGSM